MAIQWERRPMLGETSDYTACQDCGLAIARGPWGEVPLPRTPGTWRTSQGREGCSHRQGKSHRPPVIRLALGRVRLDRGGYDPAGQYWGVGTPLYRFASVGDDPAEERYGYLRAWSRTAAKEALRAAMPDPKFYR